MADDKLAIVLAADRSYLRPLTVAVAAIGRLLSLANVRLYILHEGYTANERATIDRLLPAHLQITWSDAQHLPVGDLPLPQWQAKATLYRLCLADFVDPDVRTVLYLDADVLVRDDLALLFRSDLAGRPVGAVRDAGIPWAGSPHGVTWREHGIDPTTPYFNSGVLVISLAQWTAEGLGQASLALLRKGLLHNADQEALNVVLRGRWTALDPRWNLQAAHLSERSLRWVVEDPTAMEAALRNPAIVHFNHSALSRPWEYGCVHPWREEWFRVLETATCAPWRPKPQRSVLARAVGRVTRAYRVLTEG